MFGSKKAKRLNRNEKHILPLFFIGKKDEEINIYIFLHLLSLISMCDENLRVQGILIVKYKNQINLMSHFLSCSFNLSGQKMWTL